MPPGDRRIKRSEGESDKSAALIAPCELQTEPEFLSIGSVPQRNGVLERCHPRSDAYESDGKRIEDVSLRIGVGVRHPHRRRSSFAEIVLQRGVHRSRVNHGYS